MPRTSTLIKTLDLAKHPDLLAKLQRPVNGQGGFQSLLRQLQTAFNISPKIDDGSRVRTPMIIGAAANDAGRRIARASVPATTIKASNGVDLSIADEIESFRARLGTERQEVQSKLAMIMAAEAKLGTITGGRQRTRTTAEPEPDGDVTPTGKPRRKVRMTAARKARYSEAQKAAWARRRTEARKGTRGRK